MRWLSIISDDGMFEAITVLLAGMSQLQSGLRFQVDDRIDA